MSIRDTSPPEFPAPASASRKTLEELSHDDAENDAVFQKVREIGSAFASGLKLLFFNREKDEDPIADLSLEYVAF